MNNTENNPPEFNDKIEALEFMVKRSVDKKRKDKWAKEFATGRNKSKPTKVIPFGKRVFRISAIAAILIIGFSIVQFISFGPQNVSSLALNMIEHTKFKPQETTRGSVLPNEELDKSILQALEAEDFNTALNLYKQKTNSYSNEDKFFYAVSLAKTNSSNNDKVLDLTYDILQTENEFYIESLWLSALIHLKTGEVETAKLELEQLKRYKYQTDNVNKLLSKLSD